MTSFPVGYLYPEAEYLSLYQSMDLCSTCADLFLDWIRPTPFKLESPHDGVGRELRTQGRPFGAEAFV
jgi:hypothetical protein